MFHVNPTVMLVSPPSTRSTHLVHTVPLWRLLTGLLSTGMDVRPFLADAFAGGNVTYNDTANERHKGNFVDEMQSGYLAIESRIGRLGRARVSVHMSLDMPLWALRRRLL